MVNLIKQLQTKKKIVLNSDFFMQPGECLG
jgi:hypothetical protein